MSGSRRGATAERLSRQTLEAVRRRDPDALAQLFECCFGRIYSLAFRLTGEHAAAEDVTQDVFLKVYEAADKIDPCRNPVPWLAAITYNACRERWRSPGYRIFHRARSWKGKAGNKEVPLVARQNPEHAAEAAEMEERLSMALLRLPPPLRAVVVLHDYQGLSHEEIARLTNVRHAAVRKRYSRALARLKDELKDLSG